MDQRSKSTVFAIIAVLSLVAGVVNTAGIWLRPPPPNGRSPFDPGLPVNPGQPVVSGQPASTGQPVVPGQPVAGAPDWIRPGVRLTWYVAGASVAQSRFAWVEEPCTGNNWSDPKTGKCYRRTDEAGGEGQPGASGDGLSQIDVVAIDGQNAVLLSNLYTFFRQNNTLIWAPLGGSSVNASSVDGAWIHPGQLAQIAQTGFGDLMILRGRYQLGATVYDAISFVSGLGTSGYSSYSYDLLSGLLLSATASTGGVTSPLHAPGEDPPVGNTQLTIARFAGFRQRSQPGIGGATPDWVAGTSQMTFQGTYNFTNPVDPTSGNFTHPMQVNVSFATRGAGWLTYTAQSNVPAIGLTSQAQGIAGPTGPYWYDPQALSQMTVGQVLDQDQLTGETVSVVSIGQGGSGQPVVVIDSVLPGNAMRSTYEQSSGMLLAFDLQQASAGTTISVQLVERR